MNKVILAEIAVLAILLIIAAVLFASLVGGSAPTMSQDPQIQTGQETTLVTTQATTEQTEPAPTWMTLPADRQLKAKQYFVYDVSTGRFTTISGSPTDKVYPASVTKLFTCYVALQFLQPTQLITVGQELNMVRAGSSVADLRQGDKLTVSQLVEAMLLPSGNDAAYVLAANAGKVIKGGSGTVSSCVDAFMEEMNRQAKAVGMTGANFANPDGIHRSNHYMTIQDLAILGKLSISDATIMKNAIISSEVVTFSQRGAASDEDNNYYSKTEELSADTVKWTNTNELIDPKSQYYCPYATGLKTGQTPSAGSCLLSSFDYQGKQYIIGVFGCPETPDRFEDTLQLFNETIQ